MWSLVWQHYQEIPPTAGLPLQWSDIYNGFAKTPTPDADLSSVLGRLLGLPQLQIECSGTVALMVALSVLKGLAPERREVVVPAYTCPLVALAIAYCGLQIRLCDLMPQSLDLDKEQLAALCGPQTLAIVPTHLAGRVTEVKSAQMLARRVGAWVIEDAAQALGSQVAGSSVGHDSDMVFYSLAAGKGLTIFEGGVLSVKDAQLRQQCLEWSRQHITFRWRWELRRIVELLGYTVFYSPWGLKAVYGRPLRQALQQDDWVKAAGDDFALPIPTHRVSHIRQRWGARAAQRLPVYWQQTRLLAQERRARLSTIAGLQVLTDSPQVTAASGVWPVLWVLLPTRQARDHALRALWGAGLGISLPFTHALPDYAEYVSVVPSASMSTLIQARQLASRVLSITNSPWLQAAQFEYICQVLEQSIARA